MNDVGIIVVTFMRDEVLFKCITSIRNFYPDLNIYVMDQGKPTYQKTRFLNSHKCTLIRLPWDSGLSLSRNLGMLVSKEKYIVICDDDFYFTEETKLENWREILEAMPRIGLIAGKLITRGQEWHYEHELKKFKNYYIMKDIDKFHWHSFKGIDFHYADLVLNFFMMRRKLWKDCPWDPEYKIVHEHLQFFLDLKEQNKWKVAYTPTVTALHDKKPASDEYEILRSSKGRKRLSWFHYYRKTGIRFGIYMCKAEGGVKVIDLKTGELISNHSMFLNKAYGERQDAPAQKLFLKIQEEIDNILREKTRDNKETKIMTEDQRKLQNLKDEFWRQRLEKRVQIAPGIKVKSTHTALQSAIRILEKYNCYHWLMAGTCLGAVRDSQFLNTDIDIGVFENDLYLWETFIKEFEAEGFELFMEWKYKQKRIELAFELKEDGHAQAKVDLFFYFINGDYCWHGLFGPDNEGRWGDHKRFYPCIFKKALFLNRREINFNGIRCFIPDPPEEYLERWYGTDWKIPTRKWLSWRDSRAIDHNFFKEKTI